MRSSVKWGQTTWFLFVQPHGKVGPSPIRKNLCRIHTFHRLDVHHCSLIMILLSILSFPAFRRALKTACFINSWGFSLSVLNSCCQLNMSSIFILIHHIHVDHQMTHHSFLYCFFNMWKTFGLWQEMSQQVLFLWMTHIQMPIPMLEVSYVPTNPGPGYLKTLFSWISPVWTSKKFSHKYKNT